MRVLLIFVNDIYFVLTPIMAFTWFVYSYQRITQRKFLRNRFMALWALPCVAVCIIAIVDYEFFFTITTAQNVYSRQSGFLLIPPLAIGYCLCSLVYALSALAKPATKERRTELLYIISFPFFPIIAGLVQVFSFGTALTWASVALSILLVYMNLRNRQISIDPLTGLYNRGQFDACIRHRCEQRSGQSNLFLMLMDIDKFKSINDTYGHLKGDEALIIIADLLKSLFEKHGMLVCRYGGDEFAVVFFDAEEKTLQSAVSDVEAALVQSNELRKQEGSDLFELSLSIGYAQFGTANTATSEQLIAAADMMMYAQKKKKNFSAEV